MPVIYIHERKIIGRTDIIFFSLSVGFRVHPLTRMADEHLPENCKASVGSDNATSWRAQEPRALVRLFVLFHVLKPALIYYSEPLLRRSTPKSVQSLPSRTYCPTSFNLRSTDSAVVETHWLLSPGFLASFSFRHGRDASLPATISVKTSVPNCWPRYHGYRRSGTIPYRIRVVCG